MLDFKKIHKEYREKLEELSREDLLEILKLQDPEIIRGVNRIEWVFENKLQHLNESDGSPITGRPLTKKELCLLIDVPFEYSQELANLGIKEQQQRELHIASDPVLWAKTYLNANPRVYQILILRDPNDFKVLRAGRRLGKTWSMAVLLLWYSYITKNGRSLVVTPMKAQASLIYEECLKLAKDSQVVSDSIPRAVTAPNPEINFSNGSTIRFFTSGMKSGSKSDVTRGQEAHLIVLDELDYMGEDDMDALLAMLQKTDENQPDKQLVAASTPSGRKAKLWEWCHSKRFKDFWFPSYCFAAGTKISMADGSFKNIEEIEENDLVLTENGAQKVLRTFEKDFSGTAYGIRRYGDNTETIVTGEHPYSACPSVRRQKSFDWEWIEAKDLQSRQKRNENSGHWLRSVVDRTSEYGGIYLDTLNDNFQRNESRTILERNYNRGFGREIKNSMPYYVDMGNRSLATLLGWYLAEGHVERYNEEYGCHMVVGWTVHAEEVQAIESIGDALLKMNAGEISITERKDSQAITIRIANPILAELMKKLAGTGSSTKQLSEEVMKAPFLFQGEMLNAYALGDGWITDKKTVIRTSSEQLARQIQTVAVRLGCHYPSISVSENADCHANKNYDPYPAKPSWAIEIATDIRAPLGKRKISENENALLIKKKREVEFDGKVYNFEVETTNSYIANGVLVHNCNPFWSAEMEEAFRDTYTDIGYRHEIEADWGEDADGVYPRRYVDRAFVPEEDGWDYKLPMGRFNERSSFTVFGVDWDKYGAGTNIVVLQIFDPAHEDPKWAGKIKLLYREETLREEYTLTKAVDRIIEMNRIYNPQYIYVDRGYGEVQVELLKQYGSNNPYSGLTTKLRGVSFSETLEVPDPHTGQKQKKDMKPFMVDTLRQYLEKDMLKFSPEDEELYSQLISYIVARITPTGRPVFEMAGNTADHCHDALILATLAIKQNYDDLMVYKSTNTTRAINTSSLDPLLALSNNAAERSHKKDIAEDKFGSTGSAPIRLERANMIRRSSRKSSIRRSGF